MNVGIIYAITSFVSLLQIALILNRARATAFKETIEAPFCNMLCFFLVFCVFDILWGLSFSRICGISRTAFTVISYGYHSMGALSAFIWYGYIMYYMKCTGKERTVLNVLRFLLLAMQFAALLCNIFTHEAFVVNIDGSYSMGKLRLPLYLMQFSYYIILLVYGLFMRITAKEKRLIYRNAVLFSIVPLVFGIGQYVFYDVAMYAFEFMVSGFMIYSFNLTAQREAYMQEETRKLSADVYVDALTELYNRRAYEEALEKYEDAADMEAFVYMTLDINGLKETNDRIGHEAGDELIRGVADCIRTCLGEYGKVYRIGGDEFAALLFVRGEEMEGILAAFDNETARWSGKKVKELSVSYGYVTRQECPDTKMAEMAKIADKRMYRAKANYYANRGIDRRARQDAYQAISKTYGKIMKANLSADTCYDIQAEQADGTAFSEWLAAFEETELVREADKALFDERMNLNYLKEYFGSGRERLTLCLERAAGGSIHHAVMELIPLNNYGKDNQNVFLLIKDIEV